MPAGTLEKRNYSPDEIRAFRISDGNYYVAREVPVENHLSDKIFLEYLVEGEVDIYAWRSETKFFMKKKNAPFLELNYRKDTLLTLESGKKYMHKNRDYTGYMHIYMQDAPQLYPKIDKMEQLNQKDLVNLSIDYHHAVCNDRECVNYTKKLLKLAIQMEPLWGINHHDIKPSWHAGMLVILSKPGFFEGFRLKTGLLYSVVPYGVKGNHEREKEIYKLKIPASIEYVFTRTRFQPYAAFGFPTGNYPLSSLQAGLLFRPAGRVEFDAGVSADGLLVALTGESESLFHNPVGYSWWLGIRVPVFR
jgi:hypothetical protein